MSDSTAGFDFQGQRALLYGAARGIGRAVALEFARRGAQVAIADIDREGAASVSREIVAAGGIAVDVACDVMRDESVREAAQQAEQRLGEIDIVLNNVGAIISGYPEDIPISEWERIVSLNLFSVVRSLDVFLPKMLARGNGYIVNTASFAGLYPYALNRLPYVASKSAVIALTESLALHLLPKGVRVSCLCPGPVMTGVMDDMKTWSPNAPMVGPGSQYEIKTPEAVATTLADGMLAGRILIPTDEKVWAVIQKHAQSPDQFIRDKLDELARGDWGRPGFAGR